MSHSNETPEVTELPCSRASGIFGPLDDSIDFRVNGDSKIEWMKESRKRGFPSIADFIRFTMEKEVHGADHVVSMFAKQLLGNGQSVGQPQGEKP